MENQAEITLNILRRSRIDPTESEFNQLNGYKYDYNAFPMAPPGTRAVIYIRTDGPQYHASIPLAPHDVRPSALM